MGVKVVRRRELTFWDKLYVPEILHGLEITFRHFFRNLFLHTAHRFGRYKNVAAGVTIQFPEEHRPLMTRYRSRHRLTQREDHTPRCVGCMLCETVCPAKCITIVPGEHPDPNIEKYPVRFDIDLGVCVYCGYCVEVCPTEAIVFVPHYETSTYDRGRLLYDLEDLHRAAPKEPIARGIIGGARR